MKKKLKRYQEIPRLPRAYYRVNVQWDGLDNQLHRYKETYDLDLQPDFQRAHVWTREQQIKYVEWILRGGESGRDIFLNCPGWQSLRRTGQLVLVDGLQRITAALAFLHDEIPVFGNTYCSDFEDTVLASDADFIFHVANLKTRKDILEWYIAINSGGTIHTNGEIEKVRKLLEQENVRS